MSSSLVEYFNSDGAVVSNIITKEEFLVVKAVRVTSSEAHVIVTSQNSVAQDTEFLGIEVGSSYIAGTYELTVKARKESSAGNVRQVLISCTFRKARGGFSVGDKVLNGSYTVTDIISVNRGMSNVYRVVDRFNKQWFMKQTRKPESYKDLTAREYAKAELEYQSLRNEVGILRRVNNQSIPRVYEFDESSADYALLIEDYLSAPDLLGILNKNGRFDEKLAVAVIVKLARILKHLHAQNIVYRDLKPSNIAVDSNSLEVFLYDFGISEVLTVENQLPQAALGSRGYYPLEQSDKSKPLDFRSDIFALGAVAYHMLTGKSPTALRKIKSKEKDASGEYVTAVQLIQPEFGEYSILRLNNTLSPALDKVIRKCTARNPDDRYQDMAEVIEAFTSYRNLDVGYRKTQRRKINIVKSLTGVGVISALIAGSCFIGSVVKDNESYSSSLTQAKVSDNPADFLPVIELKPGKSEPYFDMISVIQRDGVLTVEEARVLNQAVNVDLGALKSDPEYGRLMFQIGSLYWFYAVPVDGKSSHGVEESARWFKLAVEGGYDPDSLASTYFAIGDFYRTIAGSMQGSTDSGKFAKVWSDFEVALKSDVAERVSQVRVRTAVADSVTLYAYKFQQDGVSVEDMESALSDIERFVEETPVSSVNPARLAELKESVKSARESLSAVKDGR